MKRRLIAGAINRYPPEEGWENVHLDKSDRPLYDLGGDDDAPAEIVCDLVDLVERRDLFEVFDEVRCWQVLEHLTPKAAPVALKGFAAVLRPGGFLDIEVPDVEALIAGYTDGKLGLADLLGNLYGGSTAMRDDHFNAHRWGWTPRTLSAAIADAGFADPTRIDPGYQLRIRAWKP